MGLLERLRDFARKLKRDIVALYLSARDPRTPLVAKLVALTVTAYALSPIDLIPDFIPVLGQIDDLILVPLGIWLALRMIPQALIAEHRMEAERLGRLPASRSAATIIMLLWVMCAIWAAWMFNQAYSTSSTCSGPAPLMRWASEACMNSSRSPSSTSSGVPEVKPVRRSFTI
jgi:uncharacterized membrane protein YkvA (DUF1232 family)